MTTLVASLTRFRIDSNGAFGYLSINGKRFCTVERAFNPAGDWETKIPVGTFNCVRGQHQLESMAEPFTTFEITGVPGHSGLLFHVGNTFVNSTGCVLLGESFGDVDNVPGIRNSRAAFSEFITGLQGVESFTLEVLNELD